MIFRGLLNVECLIHANDVNAAKAGLARRGYGAWQNSSQPPVIGVHQTHAILQSMQVLPYCALNTTNTANTFLPRKEVGACKLTQNGNPAR